MYETVLVTGATGFVGTRLIELLRERGHGVRATYRGRKPAPDHTTGVDWVNVGNIDADTDWSPYLTGVEAVIHLAALAHQIGPAGIGRWTDFESVNVFGTRRLAMACRAAPSVRRLLLLSSVGAVGTESHEPFSEATPCDPQNDYGLSKCLAERALREVLVETDTDWCTIRAPLVYGPKNPGNMARLLRLVKTRVPLPLGAVSGKRSLIYVDNLVDALICALDSAHASREIFFVADGPPVATRDLVRLLGQSAGVRVRLFVLPRWCLGIVARVGDLAASVSGVTIGLDSYSLNRLVGSVVVDDQKIRQKLSWHPPVGFREALERTLKER